MRRQNPTPSTASTADDDTIVELPDYMLNVKRLFEAACQRKNSIKANAEALAGLNDALGSAILNADPKSQSDLSRLGTAALPLFILERRAVLLSEDLESILPQLANVLQQARHRLIAAAAKHDAFLHKREVEEKLSALPESGSQEREELRNRAMRWGNPSSDWALRLSYDVGEADEVLRLAARIFADIPAAAPEA